MKVLLTDGNAVGYQSSQARRLSTAEGRPTQAIFHSIKAMWNLKRRYSQHSPIVLWDAHCQWRYDLYPEYKAKRDKYDKQKQMREEYREQRPEIQKAFDLMGLTQVQHEGYEADDIGALYARRIAELDDAEAVLYTGDRDWLQLVAENVIWHSIDTDKRVSLKNFERETGFATISQFVQSKALQGDGSDNISGVGGIGEKVADALLVKFGSVKNMLRLYQQNGAFTKGQFDEPLNRARNKLNSFCANEKGQQDIYKRNLKLMNLHTIEAPQGGFFRKRSKPDLDGFIDFCLQWEMSTLAAKAEQIFTDLGYE